jgi:hypothetical protein
VSSVVGATMPPSTRASCGKAPASELWAGAADAAACGAPDGAGAVADGTGPDAAWGSGPAWDSGPASGLGPLTGAAARRGIRVAARTALLVVDADLPTGAALLRRAGLAAGSSVTAMGVTDRRTNRRRPMSLNYPRDNC